MLYITNCLNSAFIGEVYGDLKFSHQMFRAFVPIHPQSHRHQKRRSGERLSLEAIFGLGHRLFGL